MASSNLLSLALFLVLGFTIALASSDSPLQDFCVADLKSPVHVNGFACKDPSLVQTSDFYYSGLQIPANTSNPFGIGATPVTVAQLPGLNTQGLSLIRFDFAPTGAIAPHIHPRASEVVTVLQGTLEVGFVTSAPGNALISQVLKPGDVFIFPQGLVHFLQNVGKTPAASIAFFSSPNPGLVAIPSTVFGSKPDIPTGLLAKTFQVDEKIITEIKSKF